MEQELEVSKKLNNTTNGKELMVVNNVPTKNSRQYRNDTSRPVSFLTESEVYRLADAAKLMRNGERNELLILVLFQCALRISEAIGLRFKDKVMVGGKPILAVIGKSNKPRLVPVPEKLSHHLGDYASRNGITGDMRLFPISRIRGWQIIKEVADKAGIERRVYLHLLRHTGAVNRLAKTGNPKSLQVFLGHADIKMSMRYLSTLQQIDSLKIEGAVEFER